MVNPIFERQQEVYPQAKAQETLQQQQIAAQMAMQGMRMMDEFKQNQSVLVQQANPKKVVDEIMLSLQGFERDDNGALKKVAEPQLNSLGLSKVRLALRTVSSQMITLSHLEKEDIGRITQEFSYNLSKDFVIHWRDYGISDFSQLDIILDAILIPSFATLKRAEGQNEKNWLGKISFENLNNAPQIQKPKKEGFFSKFKL